MDYAVIHLLDEAMKLPNFKIYSIDGEYGLHIEADGIHYDCWTKGYMIQLCHQEPHQQL
jgi:hypothetical protein